MALLTPPPSSEKTYPSFQLPLYEDIYGKINEDQDPAAEVERCEKESDSDHGGNKNSRIPTSTESSKKYGRPSSKQVSIGNQENPCDDDRQPARGDTQYRIDPRINKRHSVLATPTKLTPKKHGFFGGAQGGKAQKLAAAASARNDFAMSTDLEERDHTTSYDGSSADEFMMSGGLGERDKTTSSDGLRAFASTGERFLAGGLGDLHDDFQTLEDGGNIFGNGGGAKLPRNISEGSRAGAPKQNRSRATDQFLADNVQEAEEDLGYSGDQNHLREEPLAPLPKKRGRPREHRRHPIVGADVAVMGRTRSSDKRQKLQERKSCRSTRSFKRVTEPVVPSSRNKLTARGATSRKKVRKTVWFGDGKAIAAAQGRWKRRKLVRGFRADARAGRGTRLSPVVTVDNVVNLEEFEKHF